MHAIVESAFGAECDNGVQLINIGFSPTGFVAARIIEALKGVPCMFL